MGYLTAAIAGVGQSSDQAAMLGWLFHELSVGARPLLALMADSCQSREYGLLLTCCVIIIQCAVVPRGVWLC